MDNVIMASRIALLIIVTGTFAAMWSGDQSNQIAMIDRPEKVLVGRRSLNRDRTTTTIPNGLEFSEYRTGTTGSSPNLHNSSVRLPEGITPGTYLVVDQYGRTSNRVVTVNDAAMSSKRHRTEASNHYSIQIGSERFHFIRIEQTLGDGTAEIPKGTRTYR